MSSYIEMKQSNHPPIVFSHTRFSSLCISVCRQNSGKNLHNVVFSFLVKDRSTERFCFTQLIMEYFEEYPINEFHQKIVLHWPNNIDCMSRYFSSFLYLYLFSSLNNDFNCLTFSSSSHSISGKFSNPIREIYDGIQDIEGK